MALSENDKKTLKEMLKVIERDVKILFFRTEKPTCMYCDITEDLLKDIASVNDKVSYEVYWVEKDKEMVEKYGIKEAPAILFQEYPNIIYQGIPSGHEIMAFVDDIKMVGTGKMEFEPPEELKRTVNEIDVPLDIYVFVTPQCPYCPFAVKASHRLAFMNKNIRGFMIEALEFPEWADKYAVSAVPKNVIVDRDTGSTLLEWEGCPPDIVQAVDMFAHYTAHAVLHKKGIHHEH